MFREFNIGIWSSRERSGLEKQIWKPSHWMAVKAMKLDVHTKGQSVDRKTGSKTERLEMLTCIYQEKEQETAKAIEVRRKAKGVGTLKVKTNVFQVRGSDLFMLQVRWE